MPKKITSPKPRKLLSGLWCFQDTCNVYVISDGAHAIAIDYGSGAWEQNLLQLGIKRLDHIFITHAHADQCAGLAERHAAATVVHAPPGAARWLAPEAVKVLQKQPYYEAPCPENYAPPGRGIANIFYDMAGFSDIFWRNRRIRFIDTPGHTPQAISVLLDIDGRQVLFGGDAIHAGGTIHQPYHLEWDHWTAGGTIAAWQGIERLRGMAIDLLCPSHGPVISENPQKELALLARRLLRFIAAKGQIAANEPDLYLAPEKTTPQWRRYLPGLYQFGTNGYLLVSKSGEALIVDPFLGDMPALEALLAGEGRDLRPAAMLVSHYHFDHCDAIPMLRKRFGAKSCLHPLIHQITGNPAAWDAPWLPRRPLPADVILPSHGAWQWQEFVFQVAPWPGQTWWHAVYQTTIAGQRVMFGGDTFQPPSRWNGTGGFCAWNRSRFDEGFAASARLALKWRPDIIAAGHGTVRRFSPSYFRAVIRWSGAAEQATRALCPGGRLSQEYYARFGTTLRRQITGGGRRVVGAVSR
jgi:glyoxylase-like metal-dependent hydrolase (beta-lactamase superfamily II)